MVKEALRASGVAFELVHASDGTEALGYVSSGGVPDLIFLDLNLPKADGLDLLKMIRTRPHLAEVPVAILTSSSSPVDRERAYGLGANLFITKPAGLSEFLAEVGSAAKRLLRSESAP